MDLGECTKIHDLALRADYEIASKERDLFFELDVSMEKFNSFCGNCFLRLLSCTAELRGHFSSSCYLMCYLSRMCSPFLNVSLTADLRM